MKKMIDGLGRRVRKGDVLFTTAGGNRDVSTDFAIAVSDDKPTIKRQEFNRRWVYYGERFDRDGTPDPEGYYDRYGASIRPVAEYDPPTLSRGYHMNLGFSRSVIIDVDHIADVKVREFYKKAQAELME